MITQVGVNDNYTISQDQSKIKPVVVTPQSTTVTVNPVSVVYGSTATTTVTISSGANIASAVLLKDNVKVADLTFSGKTVTVDATSLPVGNYTLSVTSAKVKNYNFGTGTGTVTVTRAESYIIIVEPISPVSYPGDVVVGYETNASVTSVVVYVNGTTTEVGNVSRDDGNVTVSGLDAGKYVIVFTVGDDNHKQSTASAEFEVLKINPTVSVDDITIVYGDSETVTVVVDPDTVGIAGAALYNGTVKVADLTVSGYEITIPADLDAGEYTLNVTTADDTNYNSVSASAVVTISKANSTIAEIDSITFVYGESGEITVVTTGASGVVAELIGAAGSVSVDGNVITISGADVGTYTLNVTTAPDKNHVAVSTTTNVTVTKAGSSI